MVCLPPPQTCLIGEGGVFVLACAVTEIDASVNASKVMIFVCFIVVEVEARQSRAWTQSSPWFSRHHASFAE
jgi:hypothetical protein